MKFGTTPFRLILSRPWATLSAALFVTLILSWKLPTLRVDNTPEVWLPSGSEGLRDLKQFRARFGEDSPILAYVSGDNLAGREADWRELATQLRAERGVAAVFAPTFVDEDSDGPPIPLRFYLSSADGRHAALGLLLQAKLEGAGRSLLVEHLEAVLAQWKSRIGVFRLAGADVITHDLDSGSRRALGLFAPLVLAAMCLVLYVASREWRAVAVSLAAIVMASLGSLGLLAWAGQPLNLVVVTMPPILAVVTITQVMHILAKYHDLAAPAGPVDRAGRIGWWLVALRETFRPNLLCAVSTAIGFASLGTSQIPPVRDLGLLTAAGIVLSFALSYTVFPALLGTSARVLPRGSGAHPWWTFERAEAYTAWLGRHSTAIFAVAGVAFVLALGGLRLLRAESHILELFHSKDRVPLNYRAIERNLIGLTPIEVVVEGEPEVLLKDSMLDAYRDLLERTLREEPQVKQVVSILLEPTRGRTLEFTLPHAELRNALATEGVPEGIQTFLRVEGRRYVLRTTLLAATESSNACQALVDRMRARIARIIPASASARVTGTSALLIEGQVLLLRTQIWSFATAFAAIALVILIAFRSLPLALLALPPNLVPVAMTLGLMGFAKIPLNTATVTVAGIGLGLVMDDTIHILHNWLLHRRAGATSKIAVTRALAEIFHPAVMTSMSFGVGFGVFIFAPFRPTTYFGLLIAATALTGMLCDVVLFPALLLRLGKRL